MRVCTVQCCILRQKILIITQILLYLSGIQQSYYSTAGPLGGYEHRALDWNPDWQGVDERLVSSFVTEIFYRMRLIHVSGWSFHQGITVACLHGVDLRHNCFAIYYCWPIFVFANCELTVSLFPGTWLLSFLNEKNIPTVNRVYLDSCRGYNM